MLRMGQDSQKQAVLGKKTLEPRMRATGFGRNVTFGERVRGASPRESLALGEAGAQAALRVPSLGAGFQTYFFPERRATSTVPAPACRWSRCRRRRHSCPRGRCSPGDGRSPRPADRSGCQGRARPRGPPAAPRGEPPPAHLRTHAGATDRAGPGCQESHQGPVPRKETN